MDETAFPSAAAYLAALPAGLASYPECQVKGTVMREMTASRYFIEIADGMPAPIRAHAEFPPIATSWVSEVHFHGLVLAVFDRFFARSSSDAGFMRYVQQQNRMLFSTPLYRVIFFVMSPERLFRGADRRWAALRRGTRLEVLETTKRSAKVRVVHPPKLYTPLIAEVRAMSLRAAAECAGGNDVKVIVDSSRDDETRFSATWD